MLQAWLVLPALYIAYLMAAPRLCLPRRYGHVAVSAAVVLAVSLSWMSVVALVPAHDRPYVDGSCNNSVFSQVFLYNGADRLSGQRARPARLQPAARSIDDEHHGRRCPDRGADKGPARFLAGELGRDAAWLFIPAAGRARRDPGRPGAEPRTDPWRAAAVLWGGWLVLTWAFFADSRSSSTSYYLAALAPPIAALCGLGTDRWPGGIRRRATCRARRLGAPWPGRRRLRPLPRCRASAGVGPWVLVSTLALAAAVAATVMALGSRRVPAAGRPAPASPSRRRAPRRARRGRRHRRGGRLGPFDSPYQPASD